MIIYIYRLVYVKTSLYRQDETKLAIVYALIIFLFYIVCRNFKDIFSIFSHHEKWSGFKGQSLTLEELIQYPICIKCHDHENA